MEWEKFLELCRRLNEAGVRYVVVGGFAVLLHGYERTTRDVDLLVETSATNIGKIRKALRELLPEATSELGVEDVEHHIVVRMVGEDMIVDLMKSIGDCDYLKASQDVESVTIEEVTIPLAGLDTMIALKQGLRGKDQEDLLFLKGKKEYLERQKKKSY